MLKGLFFILLLCLGLYAFTQTDSTVQTIDTSVHIKPISKPKPTQQQNKKDTIVKTVVLDSSRINDSLLQIVKIDSLRKDSLQKISTTKRYALIDTSTYSSIMFHNYFPFMGKKEFLLNQTKNFLGKEFLFYTSVGIVFLLALIIVVYPKYFQDVFKIFFQTTFRQKQTREQLLQYNFASVLMNLLFVICASILISLIITKSNWVSINFWQLFLYSCLLLVFIYLVKFLFLNFSGWLFNIQSATETYSFIVFLINKVLGVVFVPMLLLIAFAATPIANTITLILPIIVGLFFLYRYVVSMGTIRGTLKVNALHFFLYLCAVEVLPLMILYKALLNFFNR